MKRIEITRHIICYEDFLSQEEVDIIYNRAISAPQEEWSHEYEKTLVSYAKQHGYTEKEEIDGFLEEKSIINPYWKDKILTIKNDEVCDKIEKRLYEIWDPEEYLIIYPGKLQRQYVNGEVLQVHRDSTHDNSIINAIVIYINDNYEGGELHFPKKNISIKPKSASLITFPAGRGYEHGTTVVTGGSDRFVIAVFLYKRQPK